MGIPWESSWNPRGPLRILWQSQRNPTGIPQGLSMSDKILQEACRKPLGAFMIPMGIHRNPMGIR
eukprot:1522139-Pyramimonas_sp.AAC.1